MGKNTAIEWADDTHNFWRGCKKFSAGCKFCYAERWFHRFHKDFGNIERARDETFFMPLKWKKPSKIFTCSESDFFIKEADEWRADAWEVIKKTPQHVWIILTKRVDRIVKCLPPDWGKGYPNVWLLASVENVKTLDHRAKKLWEIPCAVRGLSIEPLIEQVDLAPYLKVFLPEPVNKWVYPFHWIIVGGETGNDNGKSLYRDCQAEWIRDVVAACKDTETPVFVKQLGTGLYKKLKLGDRPGANFDDQNFPPVLKHREFPKIIH